MMTSRRNRRNFKRFSFVLSVISLGFLALVGILATNKGQVKQIENTKSDVVLAKTHDETTLSEEKKATDATDVTDAPEVISAEETIVESSVQEVEAVVVDNAVNYTEAATYNYDTTTYNYDTTSYVATNVSYNATTLANGNTAGEIGSYAASQMAAATGVPQETWEYIIARESNGDPTVSNASGASGLFQTIPGWGSTETVEDQIQSALNAYNSQGLAAWGY